MIKSKKELIRYVDEEDPDSYLFISLHKVL